MTTDKVVVGGMGLICSLGAGVEPVFERMCRGDCGIRPLHRFPAELCPLGGLLPDAVEVDLRRRYPEEDLAVAMATAAGQQALRHAGGNGRFGQPDAGTGLILATNFGAMETLEWCWRERLDTGTMDPATFAAWDTVLERVAAALGCGGPRAQLSLSCASGAAAVALACDWLREGRADRVLAIGYDAITEYCWYGLSNLRTMSAVALRPFDRQRSGTVFGEGAAAMLLMTGRDAGRAVRPLAVVAGAATNNNAFHMTAPARQGAGSRRVMAAALRDAGLSPEDVDHVCAHATGTIANDPTEVAALRALFDDRLPAMTVAAHKSQLGHMMGAAGLAEAITTVMTLERNLVPPTVNHDEAAPECAVDCVPGAVRRRCVRVAVTNSAGIGGNNAALVLAEAAHDQAAHESSVIPRERAPDALSVLRIGWVLPDAAGSGTRIRDVPRPESAATAANAALADFDPGPYLRSVKGYLDPTAALFLAAASLALEPVPDQSELLTETGVCTVTRFGTPASGMRFFGQLLTKGPRLASPLVFPHSYASAPGNLAAIEFGLGGPHMVFQGCTDAREILDFAACQLGRGRCRQMLLGAAEFVPAAAVPDGYTVLNGAVAILVAAADADAAAPALCGWQRLMATAAAAASLCDPAAGPGRCPTAPALAPTTMPAQEIPNRGAVAAFLQCLRQCGNEKDLAP